LSTPLPGSRATSLRRFALVIATMVAISSVVVLTTPRAAAAVAVTVPHSTTAVADADLDGDPATGSWSDAMSVTIPLENGETGGYGNATLFAKHDGTNAYLRIDGQIDVPWTGPGADHFWLGMQVSPTGTSHHSTGTWDGVFFGLWDGTEYTPQPSYPPSPVDTNGFTRPPTRDAVQDAFGLLRYSGSAAPYAFVAEWKKKLNTGDTGDIAYAADGTTIYNFFVTTDSNGGGSSGGLIDHRKVTNLNTMRFASPGPANTPPVVDLTSPDGGEIWSGGSSHTILWNMSDAETATTALHVWMNYSLDGGASYAPMAGAQDISGFSNPCQFQWTVPLADSTRARIRLTALDGQGASASDASLIEFAIDSTQPEVQFMSPADGSTAVLPSVELVVSFSEGMDPASAQQAFSVRRTDTSALVTGTFRWVGSTMTFTPSVALLSGVSYMAREEVTAEDLSDPGNPLSAGAISTFTIADLPPPFESLAVVPSVQEAGQPVSLTVGFLTGSDVTRVNVTVRDVGGAILLIQDLTGSGLLYETQLILRTLGGLTFTLAAIESGTGLSTFQGSFTIVDTTPPVAVAGPDTQASAGSSVAFDGSASYDNSAIVNYTWSFAYDGSDILLYDAATEFVFAVTGAYPVTLRVVDAAGLEDDSQMSVIVVSSSVPPPTGLSVATSGQSCLELTWIASADTDLAGYRLYRWNDTPRAFELIGEVDAASTSYEDCNLEAGIVYSYWVVAFDDAGNSSPPSAIANGRLLVDLLPNTNPGPLYETLTVAVLALVGIGLALWAKRRSPRKPPPT